MRDSAPTLQSICTDIIQLYRGLAGERAFSAVEQAGNLLSRRIDTLRSIINTNVAPGELSQQQVIAFSESLLDATALRAATGGPLGVFESLALGDVSLVGRARLRRAKLLASDEEQLNWHFQLMVQAWATSHSVRQIKDLESDRRFQSGRVCDYGIVRSSGRFELLECKRVHPEKTTNNDPVVNVVRKITELIPNAIDQLNATSAIVGVDNSDMHLLVDVTAYGGSFVQWEQEDNTIQIGGLSDEQVDRIATALRKQCQSLGQVTLCWHAHPY